MKEIGSLTREEAAAITGIDVTEDITGMKTKKIKFDGKVSALVKVGQHLGMFKDGRDTVDPMMIELRQRKADMKENLSEQELVQLTKLVRKASGSNGPDAAGRDGSGNSPIGKGSQALH
jgi:hypothetical protein